MCEDNDENFTSQECAPQVMCIPAESTTEGQIGPRPAANVPRLLTVQNFPVVLDMLSPSLVVGARAVVEPTMTVVKIQSVDSELA